MLRGCVWWGQQESTYQVNEVTEVLLDLLRRQTPHQVQSTVELLFSLRQTQITTLMLVLVRLNQTQLWRGRNPHHNIPRMIFWGGVSAAFWKEIKNNSSHRLYFELGPQIPMLLISHGDFILLRWGKSTIQAPHGCCKCGWECGGGKKMENYKATGQN